MDKINKVLYTIAEVLAITLFILLAMLVLGIMGTGKPTESVVNTMVTREGVIAEVKGNETMIDTEDGNRWCIIDNGYKVGEKVIVTFEGHGTEEAEDDEVIDVKVVE